MSLQFVDPHTPPAWGIRINANRHEFMNAKGRAIPESCPEWATTFDMERWGKPGVVMWNNTAQRFEGLWAGELLQLLEKLKTTRTWKTRGIAITHRNGLCPPVQSTKPKAKPARKKKEKSEPVIQENQPAAKAVEEDIREIVHLEPSVAVEFFTFLQTNADTLFQMAEEDDKKATETLSQVYRVLFESFRQKEIKEIELSTRPLPWSRNVEARKLVCDLPPNRGTVLATDSNWFWQGCIEQPNHFKHWSSVFARLEDVLAWTEQELLSIQNTPEKAEVIEKEAPTDWEQRANLKPYWINTSAFESEQISYRVFIEVEHGSIHYKTMEMSFGQLFYYDEEFPTPNQLGRDLKLGMPEVVIDDIGGGLFGWYYIRSRTTYYQESLVLMQAQQLWERSTILAGHQAGKIPRARYGYEETETGYRTFLGGCEDPAHPWSKPKKRAEYLASQALRETLLYALDVDGFRAYRGLSRNMKSDEELLALMHKQRAKSKYLPTSAQEESVRWLRERGHPVD